MEALYEQGCRDFAESRPELLLRKKAHFDALGKGDIRWHLIGHLQSRKIAKLLAHVWLIHSIESLRTAQLVDKHAGAQGLLVPVLLQVNISTEASKQGFAPQELLDSLQALGELKNIQIVGLMTMAPLGASHERLVEIFGGLQRLQGHCQPTLPLCRELSMGMSADYRTAIACGATWIRIGSALFD